MNKPFWLWLLLVSSLFPRIASAQNLKHFFLPNNPSARKQSHHDLPGGFDPANAQEIIAQRLQELHALRQWQDQLQELLQDPDFRNSIRQIPEAQWQQLRAKVLKGEDLSQDHTWSQLLQKIDPQKRDILRRLTERTESKPTLSELFMPSGPGSVAPPPIANAPGSWLSPNALPPPPASNPPLLDRLKEKTAQWLMEELDYSDGAITQALTRRSGEDFPLAQWVRGLPQFDRVGRNVHESAMRLSHYWSDVGNFLHRQRNIWNGISSLLQEMPLPSRTPLGNPRVSIPSSAGWNSDGWVPALLCLLMLGALVVLLCKRSLSRKWLFGPGAEEIWRPGPWPVPPTAVSTRQELIQAFEHLALLHFGLAAVACHHRRLAERLAQRAGDIPIYRQAAEILAWLYEQARYAPVEETLSQDQLNDARYALCLLAGETIL